MKLSSDAANAAVAAVVNQASVLHILDGERLLAEVPLPFGAPKNGVTTARGEAIATATGTPGRARVLTGGKVVAEDVPLAIDDIVAGALVSVSLEYTQPRG
jgi:hypothetical protein